MLEEPGLKGMDKYLGKNVISSDGEKLGSVDEFHYNKLTGVAEWMVVGAGLLGLKRYIVPVAGAEFQDDGIHVPYTKEVLQQAPEIEIDEGLPPEADSILSAYYGLGTHAAHETRTAP
jgi:hypothetical protein